MTEAITIQPSRLRVASLHLIWLSLELVFPVLYVTSIHSATHIGAPFKAFFAAIAVFTAVAALRTCRTVWRIFQVEGDWKVTIGPERFAWISALPCFGLPLDVALSDVEKAVRLETATTDTDDCMAVATTFELHLTDGRVLPFRHETAGIDPHRVFSALSGHGVPYSLWTQDRTNGSTDTSKVLERTY